jgi:hypothetical protein
LENCDEWWQLPALSHANYHKLVASTLQALDKIEWVESETSITALVLASIITKSDLTTALLWAVVA